jgi:hypothetical protein
MRRLFLVNLLYLILFSCSFENNNPLENDDLLKNAPTISNILYEQNNGFVLYLAKSYPQNYTLHFERKADVAFIPITLKTINEATYADTSFFIEHDYNFMYRVRVEKGGFFSDFSNEKAFQYISTTLFSPTNFMAISVELQGVQLNWQDNSGNESSYKIEKNENSEGFQELATLPANSQTYFDEILGMPETPLNLIYRVRAFSNSMTSDWQSQTIVYSGLGAPTNLLITNDSFYNFTIEWTRNSVIATGYDVERKQDENPYALLATVASSVNTYSDFLDEIGTYVYRVRAVKDGIYSSYSNSVNQIVDSILPTEGLVAYYPFNGNANDESGNGNHGTVNGATLTADRFGNENRAYDFDANIIDISLNEWTEIGLNDFSISAWIKLSALNGDFRLILCDQSLDNFQFNLNNGGESYAEVDIYLGGSRASSMSLSWNLDTWYFMTVIRNNGSLFFYRNADVVGTANLNTFVTLSTSFSIGRRSNQHPFMGCIDDIRHYNRALFEAEIQVLYHESGWGR